MRNRNAIVLGLLATLAIVLGGAFGALAQQLPAPETIFALTLDKAIELALKHNEKGAIAREGIEQAKAAVMENASAAWPHLTGIAGYEHNLEQPVLEMDFSGFNPLFESMGLPPPPPVEQPLVYKHNWNFTLALEQNIYTFGRLSNAIRLAKQYEQVSEQNADLTDQDIVLEVQQAYFRVNLAKEALQIARENWSITQKTYENIKAKYASGIKSEFDYLQIKAELASAKPPVIESETAVALAKMNLLRLIGLPLDRDIDAVDGFAEFFPTQPVQDMVETARINRTEIRLSDLDAEMNHTTGNLFISNMLPVLAANMNYTYSGQSIIEQDQVWPEEDDWNTFWSVGVNFTWPFFDGFESYGKVRQYRSEERISRLKKVQLLKGIELEITQLAREFQALKQELAARKEAVALAEKAYGLASIRFESGLGTFLERDDAKVLWTRTKVGLAETLYKLNVSHAKLKRALGKDIFQ